MAPTSGKKPILVSGMAMRLRSVAATRSAGGQAQAAAHGDAVGQRQHRLGELVNQQVQGVLFPEELVRYLERAAFAA